MSGSGPTNWDYHDLWDPEENQDNEDDDTAPSPYTTEGDTRVCDPDEEDYQEPRSDPSHHFVQNLRLSS